MNHVARIIDPEAAHWAQAVRECRRRLGLKQFAFAEMLGTSQSAVSRWESGAQVPGYAMQNRVKDLLYRPGPDDRADRALVAQVRHALGHDSLVDERLDFVHASPAVIRDHAGEGRLRATLQSPAFRGYWRDQIELASWRAPVCSADVVSVTGVDVRLRMAAGGELQEVAHVRYQWVPVRLSTGLFVLRLTREDIPAAEARPALGQRPMVLTLDDLR